jgi:hypothetical protein
VPAASPENAAVFYKGLTGPEDLTAEQATQFLFMLANTFFLAFRSIVLLPDSIPPESV